MPASSKYPPKKGNFFNKIIAGALLLLLLIGGIGAFLLMNAKQGTDTRSQASNDKEYYFQLNQTEKTGTKRKYEIVLNGAASQPKANISSFTLNLGVEGRTGIPEFPFLQRPPATQPSPNAGTTIQKRSWLPTLQVQASSLTSPSPVPTAVACPTYYSPVCGSDGKTYSNSCYANVNGIKDFRQGTCEAPVIVTDPTYSPKPGIPTPLPSPSLRPTSYPFPTQIPGGPGTTGDRVVLNENGVKVTSFTKDFTIDKAQLSSNKQLFSVSISGRQLRSNFALVGPTVIGTIEIETAKWANTNPIITNQNVKGTLVGVPGVIIDLSGMRSGSTMPSSRPGYPLPPIPTKSPTTTYMPKASVAPTYMPKPSYSPVPRPTYNPTTGGSGIRY